MLTFLKHMFTCSKCKKKEKSRRMLKTRRKSGRKNVKGG